MAGPEDSGSPSIAAGRTLAELVAADIGPAATPARSPRSAPERSTPAAPHFRDDAQAAGLVFVLNNGASSIHQLPEMACGGVGLLDYDDDGWLDVYCVQGGPFPPAPGPLANHDHLFRNKGDGTFEDVSSAAGIAAFRGAEDASGSPPGHQAGAVAERDAGGIDPGGLCRIAGPFRDPVADVRGGRDGRPGPGRLVVHRMFPGPEVSAARMPGQYAQGCLPEYTITIRKRGEPPCRN